MTPLDQGYVDEETGEAASKPGMPNLVAQQRAAALDAGCAFWNTVDAMGGPGSAVTWGRMRGIGAGDFVHVTPRAQEILGWKQQYGDLKTIIETAWRWHEVHPDGF